MAAILGDLAGLATNVDDLRPLPGNPRRGDVAAVAKSLHTFGQRKPIVALRDGTVIAGNHTLAAAKSLGWGEIAVVRVDDDDATAKAYALADNRTAELGGYDDAELATLIGAVHDADHELLDATGWTDADLEALIAKLDPWANAPLAGTTDPDDAPAAPQTPVSVPGDLWILGPHRLLCGDATNVQHIDTLLDGARPDMIFTDPPYGMNLDVRYDAMHSGKGHRVTGDRFTAVKGDDEPFDAAPFMGLFEDVAEQFWWGADYYRTTISNGGSWIVWDKRDNDAGMDLDAVVGSAFELCWSKQKHKRDLARVLWSGHHGMQREDTKRRVHPTQKPVALVEWFFDRWGKRGDIVLDLFAGSGSTLLGCHSRGRAARLMELDPKYADVILRRYFENTGTRPVNAVTGAEYES